ncbi:hypothetical protein [Faecalitalea cylindroides]|uniref:hypothetical protein n=1 Tax=Faecalitalea cylindroides TaxID=39483 RepID=UPI00233005F4|nr:hypothetical protein [Faecalitalea cylindroides]MDB7951523.1 hypothetical protein [Faecalitalea cylindroides]MDB7958368.1 hypothetical protein [Faecalitalea cylindroides]MDB7961753.1 hypothetical protein [Faecalitalea cylindroides]MDB7962322.1 hypothetical protein [Faecalitalea cylindroides]MDB7964193.1 hypothetical protein [Faecalitalea cylindroides]
MNEKLVLTGKAVLSTVMASTMACSMLSTNILAQEPEVVPEEETTVEKTPVEEEPTETPEEATGGNEETTSSNTITTNEIVDTPTTYSFPSGYDDSWTEQKLRDEIQRLLNEAASLYEENKYRPITENDYITTKATAEAALADTTLAKDKLAWQAQYLSNCIKAMNTAQNVLSESAKQIVIINKEVAKLNPSEYQLDAWEALSSALSSARGRINGNATDDYSEDLANIQSLYEAVLQTKVDENLVTLRDLVAECEVIVNNQYYPSRRVNYTRDSYANFTNALNEARTEVNKGETTIDPAVAQTLIDNLTQAKNNLVVVDENTVGQEYGINDKWLNGWDGNYANYNKSALVRGGSLYISGYKANGDGTVTVTVKWENSGIDPVTGGMFYNVPKQAAYNKYDAEYSYRPFEENDLKNGVKLTSTVELPDGDTDYSAIKVDPLNDDEVLNGFEKDFVVPAGSKINLTLTQKGTTSKAAYTLSLGTYYVPTEAEDTVDKSELKAWIDKINALNPDDYTQESWNKLQGDLDIAEMFYELDGFKQEEIDLVVDRLEQNFNALVPADKTAPTVDLSYEMTDEGVKVTLTADEAIQSIDGWTKVSDTQYQRVYAGAVDETITVYDLAGNEAEVQLTLADKTALKEAIENFGNLEGSGSVYDNYVKVLNNGKALLEDPEATQVKVDNAARNIETCYYKVLVAALNTKYDPDTFDYSKYTTDSIIPVQNMYGITHNRTNNSYQESEAQGNIGQMKGWYEEYLKAEAGLTLAAQDEKYIGFNPDSTSVDDRQGNFAVTGQEVVEVDGVKKIRLHVSFYNDGLHPIYGEELPNANGSTEFDKFSIGKNDAKATVRTYTSEFGSKRTAWLKNITYLDGQTSYSKGFQGTFDINDGEQYVTFEYTKGWDNTYSPWYYNIQLMDMVDPECTVTYSNNGNPTNEDVTVTIQANEQLQPVEGWTLSDDGMSLTKTYSDNTSETVTVKDLTGNAIEVPVNVTGIDKEGTTVKVKNETTEDGVLVTIETSEPIQTPDGWTKVSDTKYTKLYTENTSEDIIVYDLAGNATKAHVTVSSISKPGTGGSDQDKNQGTETKKEESKKTDGTNTGVFVGTGLFAGSATAAAAGAGLLAFLKKRKK